MGAVTAFFYLLLLSLWVQDATAADLGFTRSDFPREFVFGSGTSAYQYEGAVAEDGRSPSCWDTFTHAGKMSDQSTGDVAADGYHKYMEDVKLMSETGLEAYRFSISWSRLIPSTETIMTFIRTNRFSFLSDLIVSGNFGFVDGRGAVNPKGLQYYNNLIDELVNHGNEDFTAYADVCFREFGNRVASWTTVNEPNIGIMASYDIAIFPPGRCSDPFGATKCTAGDSSVEPYIAAHNTLMAHASVVRLYRQKYQPMQKGIIGINIYSYWSYPQSNATTDLEATQRCKDFLYGWILEPLVFGDYPQVMKTNVGSRLPPFTKVQSELIKGSLDFLGINHYFSVYVNDHPLDTGVRDYKADMSVNSRGNRTGPPAGKFVSGMGSADDTLDDTGRIGYLSSYMESTLKAMRNGANVRGYFAWAFMDLFELLSGYQSRYGLYRVDFANERLRRQARLSARWYSGFLKHNGTSALAPRTTQMNQALNLVS
ncbi:Beta-glucosidase 3 [Triticum urartu]|uniref:Beta-glucosidase 3 n=1 Tax=Triticum urartu TaxID=4572 RepID=M7ZDE0_TRIUA|nr:Beta-glucosidase 3 [Triticum urartu]